MPKPRAQHSAESTLRVPGPDSAPEIPLDRAGPAGDEDVGVDLSSLEYPSEQALIDAIDGGCFPPDEPDVTLRLEQLEGIIDTRGWRRGAARVEYLRAQNCIAHGAFQRAVPHIRKARRIYNDAGDALGAARTRVSELVVLIESGRYREALRVGESTLKSLRAAPIQDEGARRLTAMLLQNMAICHEARGEYERAIQALTTVEAVYRHQADMASVAATRNNAAINWMHLDRFDRARCCLVAARRLCRGSGNRRLQAQIFGNLGKLAARCCRLDEALTWYQQAARALDGLDAQAERLVLARKEADCFFALNLLREAEHRYRESIAGLELIQSFDQLGRAHLGLAGCLSAMGRLVEAGQILAAARRSLPLSDHSELSARVALSSAALARQQGDLLTADQEARRAYELLSPDEHPLQVQEVLLLQAELAIDQPERAQRLLDRARQVSGQGEVTFLTARRQTIAAQVALAQGRPAAAEGHFRRAIRAWDRGWPGLLEDAFTRAFFSTRADAFRGLAQILVNDSGSECEALGLLEEPRNRALRARMGRRAVRTAPMRGENSEWDRVCDHLDHLYSALVLPQGQSQGSQRETLSAICAQESRLAQLRVSLSRRTRGVAMSRPVGVEAVLGRLAADVDVVAYHMLGGELVAFLWSQGRLRVVKNLASQRQLDELTHSVSAVWSRYRGGQAFVSRFKDALKSTAERALDRAHQLLIKPLDLDSLPAGSQRRTVFVPCGSLNMLPFSALGVTGSAMLDRGPIGMAPSVELLALLGEAQPRPINRVLLVATDSPDLPGVQREARRIHAVLSKHGVDCVLLSGGDATREALTTLANDCDVVHFASHGVFRPESPESSAIQLADGWLNAVDIMHLDLPGATVVFSACETGRSQIVGAEDSVGLGRAAMVAGAQQVILTQWLLDDVTAADLMIQFYRELVGGRGCYAALHAAQVAAREHMEHAYYWAPFVLLGYPFTAHGAIGDHLGQTS